MPKRKASTRPRPRRHKRPTRRTRSARRVDGSRKSPQRAIEAALAGVAHDIRTPLTGILALAELLAASDLGAREREWSNAIKSGAEHIAALTTLIVDAAKAEATGLTLRRAPFSPRALMESVGRALSARAETKGVKAEVTIARNLPAKAAADSLRLRAALENLADNAVKFTDRGTVRLAANAEPAARGRFKLIFTVTDSGIGLSKQEIGRLFRPFAQASEAVARRYGGAGLGLVFVKRIARAMGGDLTVTSTPGRGSTFRLTVTADLVAGGADSARENRARAPAGRSLRILCAEDNPYGRVVMNTILTELGHRTDFVESGEAAVKAVQTGGYDAVLMDVTLSGSSGIEATRRIRALPGKAGRVAIIGISGRSESGNEAAARAAGMNDYFAKPVSPGKLAQALARVR